MPKETIAERVTAIVAPTVEQMGYTLWDVVWGKVGADLHLEIIIDKPEGITIDDCEAVHRAVDPLLDEADPIEDMYYLDVSSPGIERELRTDAHILASLGETCECRFFAPLSGSRVWKGTLVSYADGVITLSVGEEEITFPRSSVSRIKTVFFD